MAATVEQVEFVRAEAAIRAAVEGRLTVLFTNSIAVGASPADIRDSLTVLTRAIVAEYGQAAAQFAADWYNDMRLTAAVGGTFTASPTPQDFTRQIEETVRRAVGTLFTDQPDIPGMVKAIVSKGSQYAVDGARNTIVQNSYRDPRASGWQRIPFGPTCDFCLMLVGRGGVYKRSTATFRAHGGCDCGAAPSWDPNAVEVPEIAYQASARMQGLRDAATQGSKSAQRQLNAYRGRVQQYITDHQGEFAQLRQDFNLTPATSPVA